nr:hypothetical protein CFP56_41765 [Quercus suber]
MAKIAVVALLLSLVLALSIHSVFSDENSVQTAIEHVNQAASTVQDLPNSVSTAVDNAKEKATSWFQWFEDILEALRIIKPDD